MSWYRRAWVVASSSQREGWGMTLTEAAACGTPAVATAIAGHADAVLDGESGLLVDDLDDLAGRARARAGRRRAAQPAVEGRAGPGALVHLGRHGPPRPRGAGRGGDAGSLSRPRRAGGGASAVDADDRSAAAGAGRDDSPGAAARSFRRRSGFGTRRPERRDHGVGEQEDRRRARSGCPR